MSHFHPHGKPEEPAKSLAELVREAHGWCRDFDYHKTLPNATRCGSMYHAAIDAALRKAVEATREEDADFILTHRVVWASVFPHHRVVANEKEMDPSDTAQRIMSTAIRSLPVPEGVEP